MNRAWTMNIAHARYTLGILGTPIQEFPAGNAQSLPESGAAGGSQFQHWRRFRAGCYIEDAMPTETGYQTIGHTSYTDHVDVGTDLRHRWWLQGCTGEREALLRYNEANVRGIAYLPTGTVVWTNEGQVLQGSSLTPRTVKGINADAGGITHVTGVAGRLIVTDGRFLYWSGIENPFDFTPSLRTGAGSTGHTLEIGDVVQLLPSDMGFYVLGTTGGLYAACSGDLHVPFDVRPIANFNGIYERANCVCRYEAATPLVYSRAGLQWLDKTLAKNDYPDVSAQLRNKTVVSLLVDDGNEPLAWGDAQEYHDNDGSDEDASSCRAPQLFQQWRSHWHNVRVVNVDPRYATISYAYDGESYERLYVIDLSLDRTTVLLEQHTDVVDKLYVGESDGLSANYFITARHEDSQCIQEGCEVARLYFHELMVLSGKTYRLSKIKALGDFCTPMYAAHLKQADCDAQPDQQHWLPDVVARQGIDRVGSWYNLNVQLTHHDRHEVQYAGQLRQVMLSFVLKFSGNLGNLIIETS